MQAMNANRMFNVPQLCMRIKRQASYRLGVLKKSRKHCEKYLSAYEKYKEKPIKCIEEQMDFLINTFRNDEYTLMLFWLMRIDIEDGTWDPVIGHNDAAAAKAREKFQDSVDRDYAKSIIPNKFF